MAPTAGGHLHHLQHITCTLLAPAHTPAHAGARPAAAVRRGHARSEEGAWTRLLLKGLQTGGLHCIWYLLREQCSCIPSCTSNCSCT